MLGASNVWGTTYSEMYIRGELSSWNDGEGLAMTQSSEDADIWTYEYTATADGWKAFKFVASNSGDWSNQWGASSGSNYPLTLGREYETYGNNNNANIQINLTSGCKYIFTLNTSTNKYIVTSPQSKKIYFYNTLGWSNIYLNMYTGAYFDGTNGSGNYDVAARLYVMSQVGSTNYWECDYTGSYTIVSFVDTWWDNDTDGNQRGKGNFNSGKASYRTDFATSTPVFVPQTTSNETKNGCEYYSNGVWIGYDATSFTRSLPEGRYGTICSPVNATISGATLYEIVGKNTAANKLYIEETSASTTLTAGVPYFFKADGTGTQTITLNGLTYQATAQTANGLVGAYAVTSVANNDGNYVLSSNTLLSVSAGDVNIAANRAYVHLADVSPNNYTPSAAPGRPIVAVSFDENNATAIEAVEESEGTVKFFENGQILIKRDGITYDVMGRVVK